jgi:hypothetical protein
MNTKVAAADITLLKSSVLVPASVDGMAAFEKNLGKLNAKATKFGLPPITTGEPVRERYTRRYESDDERRVHRMYVVPLGDRKPEEGDEILYLNRIELNYPIIALGSWKVLGKIEPFGEGRITFAATDVESELEQLSAYRESEPCCDHCKTKRRRKETYVVRHTDTAETKQIGSACLQDFTGIDPVKVLFLAQMYAAFKDMADDYEHFMGGVGCDHGVRPVDFLRDVLFVTEWQGDFVSSKRAKEYLLTPTYRVAMDLADELRGRRALIERYEESRERLLASAQRVIDWWTVQEPESEFERTAQQVVTAEAVPYENKFLAIAAASISAMDRALAKAMAKEARAARPSEHVGKVGEKLQQPMRVTGRFSFDGDYGTQFYVNFVDVEGNKYSWKTANPPYEFGEPDAKTKWFDGKFKIKKHGDFRDEKITDISHVKFVDWIPAPAMRGEVAAVVESSEPKSASLLVVDVSTMTQAFDDIGWRQQMAMLLRHAAEQLRDPRHDVLTPMTLQDINGNEVGSVSFPRVRPQAPADGHLQIVMEPGTRDRWVDTFEESAQYVLSMEAMSDGRLIESKEGQYREVASLRWDALLERDAALEVGLALRDEHETEMP